MFFLVKLKPLVKMINEDSYFYNRDGIGNQLEKIVGATDYLTARIDFSILCEDLQIVLKFVLGFLDYKAFKELENSKDEFDSQLKPKPFLAKATLGSIENYNFPMDICFIPPEDTESEEDKKEREQQIFAIYSYVDTDKLKSTVAKLTGKRKTPELQALCQQIKKHFEYLRELRSFLHHANLPAEELISVSADVIENVLKSQAEVMATLGKIKNSIDNLKLNLENPLNSVALPSYSPRWGYFLCPQPVSSAAPDFMKKFAAKFPGRKVLYIVHPDLMKDSIYYLLRELSLAYEHEFKFVIEFSLKLDKSEHATPLDNQKQKNFKKFTKAFLAEISELKGLYATFFNLFPALLRSFNDPTSKTCSVLNEVVVICQDLPVEELPEQDDLKVKLINKDRLVLAYADLAVYIISLAEYLRAVTVAFKKVKILSITDIETALLSLNKSHAMLQENYNKVLAGIVGNTFALENNQRLIKINNTITKEITPQFYIITNSTFGIKSESDVKIKKILKSIIVLNKKINEIDKDIDQLHVDLPELKTKCVNLEKEYKATKVILQDLTDLTAKVNKELLDAKLLPDFEVVERHLVQAQQFFNNCGDINDSNQHEMIKSSLTVIHMIIKNSREMLKTVLAQAAVSPKEEEQKITIGDNYSFSTNRFRLKLTVKSGVPVASSSLTAPFSACTKSRFN